MAQRLPRIDPGFHVFLAGEEEECGAVRDVRPQDRTLVIDIENGGDFIVDYEAVAGVVDDKVLLDPVRISARMSEAIAHAHDLEDYPPPDYHPPPETGSA